MSVVDRPGADLTPPSISARRRPIRVGNLTTAVVPPLVVFVLAIAVWAAISSTIYGDENYILPRPTQVVSAAWQDRGDLFEALRITFVESAIGFGAAIAVGITTAVIMSQAKAIERSLYPYAVMLQTVPVVAIAPIIVIWFGFNQRSVIIVSFIIALFPIINNTLLGLLSTDRNHADLFRLHRAGRVTEFLKLRLPTAMPSIVAGLRVSAGLSVIGAIVGEFIIGAGGTEGGLGVKIIFAQARLDTDLMFAQVLAATLLGFSFFLLVSYVGYLFLHTWHESAVRDDV
jgi:NitT/TauT family transport system permease protein